MRNATYLNNKVSNEIKSTTDLPEFKIKVKNLLEVNKNYYKLEIKIQKNNESRLQPGDSKGSVCLKMSILEMFEVSRFLAS